MKRRGFLKFLGLAPAAPLAAKEIANAMSESAPVTTELSPKRQLDPSPVYYGPPQYEYATAGFTFSAVGRTELRREWYSPPTDD